MRWLMYRLLFLTASAVLLVYGLCYEQHPVRSLEAEQVQIVSGPGFIEGATVDSYMLREGQLFDIYSLTGATAQEKDCKT